ncbi:S-layer homology domain-containing protein [Megasphaera massiliensis]|uniref:S-layer homology domain-containing protein n=5 Tax=Megasphaera TaxID=906 RepID=UPI00307A7A6C
MTVKLNKDINLGETGSVTTGNTVVNNDGVKVGDTTLTTSGLTITNGPSVTTAGIDGGSKQITNVSSGSDGVDADGNPTYNNLTNGANIGDIKNITDAAKTELTNDGLNFTADSGDAVHRNLGETLNIAGDGNITTTSDATNGKITVGLSNTVAVGDKGSEDGSLTVNGADGSSVAINGADGTIALNTADGSPVTIGAGTQVNNLAGTPVDRITVGGQTVATMSDGLKFAGDDGQTDTTKVIPKTLNEQLDIIGGAEGELTDKNIGVNNVNGQLKVQLVKDVDLGSTGSLTVGNTVVNNDGIKITPATGEPVSLTGSGLDNGNNVISNVATGVKGTDAVNVDQLTKAIEGVSAGEGSKTNLTVEGGTTAGTSGNYTGSNLQITEKTETTGATTYDVKLADNITLGSKADTAAGTEGTDSSITVNGKDGSAVAINGADGSIALNTADGSPVTIKAGTAANDVNGNSINRITVGGATVATLDDGMVYTGDTGSAAVKLNKTVNIVGGETDASKLSTDNNIGIVAAQDGDNGKLTVRLAKDITGLNTVTAGDATIGTQTETTAGGITQTGSYVTGLDNTTWNVSNPDIVTGRAATEDQLKTVSDAVVAVTDGTSENATGGFGLADGSGTTVKQDLGKTITVKGGVTDGTATTENPDGVSNITTAVKDGALEVSLNKDLDLGSTGSVTTGNTVINNDGVKVGDTALTTGGLTITNGPSVTTTGIDAGSKQITNVASGSDGVDDDGNPTYNNLTNGANIGDIKNITDAAKTELTNDGLNFTADSGDAVHRNLGETLNIAGDGNITTTSDATNGKITVGLSNTVAVGESGSEDGSLTVNGADGSAVAIDGSNGSIALNTGSGSPVTIQAGISVNDVTGSPINRITVGGATVATLNDGMKYGGDFGTVSNVKLNNQVDVKGEATTEANLTSGNIGVVSSQNGDNGLLVVKLNKDLNLGENGSVTTGNTVINNSGVTIGSGDTAVSLTDGGLNNGGNKITNVATGTDGTDAVNVAQLEDRLSQITIGESKTTEVTVEGGTEAPTDGTYAGDNLQVKAGTTANGSPTYDVKLADNITLGSAADSAAGTTGTDGSITLNGANGSSVAVNGANGSVTAKGTDGSAVAINGSNGSIELNTESGSPVTIQAGTSANNLAGTSVDRISVGGQTVATMSDGLKYAGDDGQSDTTKVIAKTLNEQLDIVGGADATKLTDNNIGVNNVNGQLKVQLVKDINLGDTGSVTVGTAVLGNQTVTTTNGVSQTGTYLTGLGNTAWDTSNPDAVTGRAATEDQLKAINDKVNAISTGTGAFGLTDDDGNKVTQSLGETIQVAGDGQNITTTADAENGKITVALSNDISIGAKDGDDGTDGVDGKIGVNGKDGSSVVINGKDGSIGLTGPAGADGTPGTTVTIKVADPVNNVSDTPVDRITVGDQTVATLTDGMKYGGDFGTVSKVKLNNQVNVKGEATTEANLTTGNIGVVSSQDGDNGLLTVKLNKDINLGDTGSVKTGATVINNDGVTITPSTGKPVSLTGTGLNNGGNTITNVAAGTADTDAVNYGQLKAAATAVTVEGGTAAGTTDYAGNNLKLKATTDGDKTTYDLKLADKITLGSAADSAAGTEGTDSSITVNGKDGSAVAINGADGSIALNTADGSPVTIKAGTAANDVNGNSINRVTVGGATVATLDDGMKYTGDTGSAAVKLNKTVNIVGGETDSTKLSTDNNIGIVAEQDGDNGKLTVRLAKDITGLNTVTAGDATIGTQTEMTASGVAQTGSYVTGLDNTTWNVSDPDIVSGRAATEDQLKTVSDAIMDGTSENATGGFGLTDDSGNAVKQDLGKTIQIAGDGQNITTTADATNGKITVALSNDISIGAKDGADGTDGVDGKIGVNGKDGSAVVINGADGSIGLTGPAGADGTPGTTVTIKVADPVNDVTGTPIDRITVGGATVATLDDGMKYGGDFGTTSAVKLNNQVNVKGNATTEANLTDGNIGVVSSQDGDNGLLTVKLNKDINLGDTGSVKTGATVINNDGVTITPSTGNPVTLTGTGLNNGGNKITNVAAGDVSSTSTDAVNGSQLKAVQDIAEKHTVVTVEDGTAAGTTDYTGNNLKLKATEVDGQTTYDLKLADNLTIGAKDGTNGSIGVNGSDGNVVTIDGNDGISIKGADGKDGVSITGKDGVDGVDGLEGHIGLNGKDGVTDIYTTPGDAGVNGADGDTMTRIIYTDPEGTNHQVATLDDGMKYTGDTGSAAVKLNKTVNIVGGETDSTKLSTDNNIGIVAEQDNDNAKLTVRLAKDITGLNTVTAGDATIGNQTEVTAGGTAQTGSYVTGLDNTEWNMTSPDIVSGRAATEDQLKTVSDTVNALADGTSENATGGFGLTDDSGTAVKQDIGKTIQIAGDGNITTTADATSGKLTVGLSNTIALGEKASEDGSTEGTDSSITVNGKDGSAVAINGADGTIALNTADGSPVTIGAGTQVNNLAGTPIDRITIGGATVATLDDGMKYYGDFGEVASVKLNNQVNMEGEATSEDDLTTGNIGVVSSQDGDNALLTVKLNKDINLGSSGSVTTGNTVINNSGVTITPTGGNPVTLTDAGLNNGGNKIINVAPGAINDDSMDAVNGSQLNEIRKLAAQHTYVTVEGGTEGEAAEYAGKNLLIQTKRDNNLTTYYDLKLSDNITLGSANDDEGTGGVDSSITLNGADGSSVAIDGATGSVALTGTDGSTATIAAGTQANNLVGTAIDRITAGGSTVATLDDGMKYGGDFGTASAVKLNNQVNVKGNATTEADLTDGNIGVVSSQDGDNGLLTVKLNKDINLGDTGSVTIGNTVVNNSGVAIGSGDTAVTLTDKGLNNGGNQITNVASGTTGTTYDTTVDGQENYNNAANIGDLTTAINDVKYAGNGGGFGLTADDNNSVKQDLGSTITVKGGVTEGTSTETNSDGVSNITTAVKDGVLEISLNKDLDLGSTGSVTTGNTVINNDGVKVGDTTLATGGLTITNGPSVTTEGIDGGSKQITNVASGSDGVDENNKPTYNTDTNAANIGDIKNITDSAKSDLTNKGMDFTADNGETVHRDLGEALGIVGDGQNITTTTDSDNGKISVGLSNDISIGKAGTDGVDGKIGVNGKDGSAVVINGADGSIGLTGPAGADGTPGTTVNIKVGPSVNDVTGTPVDRITVGDQTVATLSDGMKYGGDFGTASAVKLNNQVNVKGNATTEADLTDGNIGVVSSQDGDNGLLTVKLNKDLNLGSTGSVTMGNTVVNNGGVTITPETGNPVSLTGTGLNNGGNQITNVASGTTGETYDTSVAGQENYNNAANIGDLTTAINDVKGADKGGGFGLTADDGKSVKQDLGSTITVTGDTNIETKVTDDGKLQVGLKDNVDLGQDGSLTAGNTTIDKDGVSTDKIAIKDSGISIDKDGINAGNKQIKDVGSGLGNNYDTSVEGQENYNNGANIGDVYNIAKGQADAVKAQSGKNITVDADNKVNLNDNITLGDNSDASKQVNIDGNGATVTAGSGDNQVKLDGSKGQISAGGAVLGNQANTANDGNPATGNYLTGLDNTTWDGTNIQSGRAATEDQLKVVDDKVSKGRVFQGDDGADNSVTVGLGDTLKLNGGADTSKLSSGNIGVVRNSSGDGLDIKLSKDLKDLDSVTTGNTTINNNGVTIKTVDSDRTITIQDSNVNMGNNVVSGVADGTVAPGSTEAVNGGQLALRDQAINNLGGEVNKLDNRINRVGAGAAALAALHPQDFDPDDKWDFAFGYGHYRGANAGAFGAFYKPNEDTTFSVGGTIGGGENMINAGVSFKLGQGNNVSNSRVGMAKEIKHLRDDVAKLEDIVNRQSQMINQLTGQNPGTIESKGSELFPDVPANHWAYEYVTKLHQLGIIEGYPDGNFDGNRMMTRYEFAAVVYRAIMAGAASNAALQGDDTLDRLANEFSAELKYIRIDTIAKDKDGKPTIQRVRIVPENKQN